MEKDLEKAKRLQEVYKHVFAHFDIKSQKDFADFLKIQRTGLSAAMNGSKANLTKNLFMKICAAFPGVFNLDYLLTGQGSLLTIEEEIKSEDIKKTTTPTNEEMSANILELYARMIRGVDDLRIQIKEELERIRTVKAELQDARDEFRKASIQLTQAISSINGSRSYDIAADS